MNTIITHRFLDFEINPLTETLFIGTFNPETEKNKADFFYGRSRNFFWRLLPLAFYFDDLKKASKEDKIQFITDRRISFIDIICSVEVPSGHEADYYDGSIDKKVLEWRDVIAEIKKLHKLKRVAFTRKTFSDISQMKKRIEEVEKYCADNYITFQCLTTPARFYSIEKQKEWKCFLNDN
jgi:G:T/U-mismatch repair DNA glycosylase